MKVVLQGMLSLGIYMFMLTQVYANVPQQYDISDSELVSMEFESLFPDSPYRKVMQVCMALWQEVRALRHSNRGQCLMNEEQIFLVNEKLVDYLVMLHARIGYMLQKPRACSPDDLEYLMGILQLIHVDYSDSVKQANSPYVICNLVLLNRIKEHIERRLEF